MKLKIKVKPQDFIVEEIASLPLAKNGPFGVYILTKENWSTVELLHELARKLNIPYGAFSYGGRKDRHSQSQQYISIKSTKCRKVKEKDYSLRFIGFMPRPMGPDLIEGNKFEVVVRKLSPADIARAISEIEIVKTSGFPNYFDDQRFGSFDSRQGFLAEKALKEQFNGALKIYLTSVNPADKKEERQRRGFFFEHWKDWPVCLSHAENVLEKEAFAFLIRKPSGFLEALKKISREELSGYFTSYQAYLWNEVIRRLVSAADSKPHKTYPGVAGDYIFPDSISDLLKDLTLPLPGAKAKFNDKESEGTYLKVLADNGLKQNMFNKLKLRQAFFKSTPRKAIVTVENLSFAVSDDEIYSGKKKLTLKFSLPRGSFATMLVKRIFS